jgi:hypothetical protein
MPISRAGFRRQESGVSIKAKEGKSRRQKSGVRIQDENICKVTETDYKLG